jgi:hypothetical protein
LAVQGFCFIDQHDGDIIPNFIQKLAMITDQPVLSGIEPKLSFAFRASQDLQQFLAKRHFGSLSGMNGSARQIHPLASFSEKGQFRL